MMDIEDDDDIKKLREKARKQFGPEVEKKLHDAAVNAAIKSSRKSQLTGAIKLLHDSTCTRILQIADKLCVYRGNVAEIKLTSAKLELPEDRYWGFSLGDRVKVKGTFEEFKSMQKAALGWNGRLRTIYGKTGIIKSHISGYDNSVKLFFPHSGAHCTLYAGVLENVTEPDDLKERGDQESETPVSRWNVGDMVTVIARHNIATIMQNSSIPTGKKGQILGFAGKEAIVTFDGRKAHLIKTALLLASGDQSPIEKKVNSHPNFKVGEKVTITKNMKKLIENQKDKGGWKKEMSLLRGKDATILNIQDDGSLKVQLKNGSSWKVNANSVLKADVSETDEESDVFFKAGDVVKVKIPPNVRSILEEEDISLTFIEYMRLVGVIGVIDKEYQPYVRFNNEKYLEFNKELLRIPTDAQKRKYIAAQEKVDHLVPESEVYLDVGPPNFAREVLRDAGKDKAIISALTTSSKLAGFLPNNKAVIKYDDGSMFSIKKKYLTVPERFYIEKSQDGFDFNSTQQIVSDIQEAIRAKDEEKTSSRKGPFKSINISSGNPPNIHISVHPGIAAGQNEVIEYLKQSRKRKIEVLCKGEYMIRDDFGKVKLRITFPREDLGFGETVSEEIVSYGEKSVANLRAEPFVDSPGPSTELQGAPVQCRRLYDPEQRQYVYVPCHLFGVDRPPEQRAQRADAESSGNTINTVGSNVITFNIQPRP